MWKLCGIPSFQFLYIFRRAGRGERSLTRHSFVVIDRLLDLISRVLFSHNSFRFTSSALFLSDIHITRYIIDSDWNTTLPGSTTEYRRYETIIRSHRRLCVMSYTKLSGVLSENRKKRIYNKEIYEWLFVFWQQLICGDRPDFISFSHCKSSAWIEQMKKAAESSSAPSINKHMWKATKKRVDRSRWSWRSENDAWTKPWSGRENNRDDKNSSKLKRLAPVTQFFSRSFLMSSLMTRPTCFFIEPPINCNIP